MNLEAAKVMKTRRFRTGRLALYAFPMRRGTAVRNRPDIRGRRRFRPGRDGSEWGMLLDAEARKRGVSGDPTACAARLTLGWKADKRSPRRLPQRGLVHRTRATARGS